MSCFFLWITINYFILTGGNSSVNLSYPLLILFPLRSLKRFYVILGPFRNEDIVKVHISLY